MEIERFEKEADDNRRKTVIFENPMAGRKGRKGNRTKQVVTEVEMTSVTGKEFRNSLPQCIRSIDKTRQNRDGGGPAGSG